MWFNSDFGPRAAVTLVTSQVPLFTGHTGCEHALDFQRALQAEEAAHFSSGLPELFGP